MMIRVIGNLERHRAGEEAQVIPQMPARDGFAIHAHDAVVLEVIEGFDPKARDRNATADDERDASKNDLRQNCLPQPMPNRPAPVAALLKRITFNFPRHQSAGDDGAPGKAVERRAAACGVLIFRRADINVMADRVANIARAIEITHLEIGADELR